MIPPIASRFVAGESVAEALEVTATKNDAGLRIILNQLGEHYEDPAAAAADRDDYMRMVRDIDAMDLDACISVKPTQLGLGIGEETFRDNLEEILEVAEEHDRFVWLDMEDHTTTDATIDAYEETVERFNGGIGVCLQANLKRTPDDLERLAPLSGKLRLVKGAYKEPKAISYRSKERINLAYRSLVEQAFEQCDDGIAMATHDDGMLDLATRLHEEHGTAYEIQMLMGVREDRQRELTRDHEVYQYIPFGDKWLSYFYRRLVERKENVTFALRAILGR